MKGMNMNLLILHPDLKKLGGIEGYYLKLCKHFTFRVHHFTVGKRVDEKKGWRKYLRLLKDYILFVQMLNREQIDIVQANPSLEFKSFIRDGLFVLIARMKRRKVVTFFRGWDVDFEHKLNRYGLWIFKLLYGGTDAFVVLSEKFRQSLNSWGKYPRILKENTIIDDESLYNFDINEVLNERRRADRKRILFLSRIFKEKGIYETLEAFRILKNKYRDIELVVAGDGVELEKVKNYVSDNNISDVVFTGDIRGEKKTRLFIDSHIFCFPTSHNEGMPNAILEAMSFGIPIVTRPVGGLVDFFEDGKHGYLCHSSRPEEIAHHLEVLLASNDMYEKVSLYNAEYAKEHFSAALAAKRFEQLYQSLMARPA